jgi:diketogulonate reductase-like aldo/keto reductase
MDKSQMEAGRQETAQTEVSVPHKTAEAEVSVADNRGGESGLTRRKLLVLTGACVASQALVRPSALFAAPAEAASAARGPLLTRAIPSSGELLPLIGLGTWQTFDVDASDEGPQRDVMAAFVRLGGKVVDSSPMYGRSEEVVGDVATKLRVRPSLFLATKVWTTGRDAGVAQMTRSSEKLRSPRIDLMQVHNLVDTDTHLATLRRWRQEGRVRYIGITHYERSAYADVERILRREKIDFLQINYNIAEPEAAERLLPLAHDRGVAVIANRPFGGGELFRRFGRTPVPQWAADFDCHSWAQFFLKWIVSDRNVNCAIPATSKVDYLTDNMAAGYGRLPDAATRRRMRELFLRT